jgi:ligand-binding sensor domain-containing protein
VRDAVVSNFVHFVFCAFLIRRTASDKNLHGRRRAFARPRFADSAGFARILWFCTGEGLSRFDGFGVTNFTVADGLPNRTVNDFLETENGTIYVATSKGLARLNPRGARLV